MLPAKPIGTASGSEKPFRNKSDGIGVVLLLSLCVLPFGWVGLAAPLIWLSLSAIETCSGWKLALAYGVSASLILIAALGLVPGSERIELLPPYSDARGNQIYASFNAGKAAIAAALVIALSVTGLMRFINAR